MATGAHSDFKIYPDFLYAGIFEAMEQTLNGFNAGSNGAIILGDKARLGAYAKEVFFKQIANLISRRNLASTSAATGLKIEQGEFISVKLARKIGPAEVTLGALRAIASDQEEMSFLLGKNIAEEVTKEQLNVAIMAAVAAVGGQTALVYDATNETTKTLIHAHLAKGMAKRGDKAQEVACFVLHSKPYFDLVGQAIADKIDSVAGAVIYGATAPTLGRPAVVVDAPALHDDNASDTDTYNTLGLVPGAVIVENSEVQDIVTDVITGLEQIILRIQGEYSYNVGVKGFKWDTTNGGENPSDATLATTTNWDKEATSSKNLAGVLIKTE